MKPEMIDQIVNLRLEGVGYQTIAKTVGTSKENVRYFCKTHGLAGNAKLVRLNYAEYQKSPDVCKHCGGRIVRGAHSGKKIFCSETCRRSWWKFHPEESKKCKENNAASNKEVGENE